MDNREAMIAAFNKSVLGPYMLEDDLHLLHERALISTTELNEKRAIKVAFKIAWQAATAHNTDAVIDLIKNEKSDWDSLGDIHSAHVCGYLIERINKKFKSIHCNAENKCNNDKGCPDCGRSLVEDCDG